MAYYKSLREYLDALDKAGKLITVNSPVNKDTELSPMVYLHYRGQPLLSQHKGMLFTNVTDSKGRKYDIPVAQDVLYGFPHIGLKCKPGEVQEKIAQAAMHPLATKMVTKAPVQEVVYMGDRLLEKGGLEEFPVPITHPGWDASPIMSGSCWRTRDPETGAQNTGTYRCDVCNPTMGAIHIGGFNDDIETHWQKARARGIPLQAAIVIGGPPNVAYVGPMKFPYDVDEYAYAGAMVGEAVELVKCKTVDLEVPANAEFIIEGELTTEERMLEGPHGEGPGLVSIGDLQPFFTVKCITHRKDPIWLSMVQFGPGTPLLYKRLHYDLNMPFVLEVGSPHSIAPSYTAHGGVGITAIKIKSGTDQKDVWRALEACAGGGGGMIVAVNEHIDIKDLDMVLWSAANKTRFQHDTKIIPGVDQHPLASKYMPEPMTQAMRRAQFHPESGAPGDEGVPGGAVMLINGTQKWPMPPLNLPQKKFMESALKIWKKENLPELDLKENWYGVNLGFWPHEFAEDAERAVKGDYAKTYERRYAQRVDNRDLPPGDYHRVRDRWKKYPPEVD